MLYFAHRNLHGVICIPKTHLQKKLFAQKPGRDGVAAGGFHTHNIPRLLTFHSLCAAFPTKAYVLYDALKIKANISGLYSRSTITISTQAKSSHINNLQLFTKGLVM